MMVDVVFSDYAVHNLRQLQDCWGYVVIPSGFDHESLGHSQFLKHHLSVVPNNMPAAHAEWSEMPSHCRHFNTAPKNHNIVGPSPGLRLP